MNKDYEKQESTEELTTKIISESKEIMNLLQRDGIKVEEIYKNIEIQKNEDGIQEIGFKDLKVAEKFVKK